tara:strand:- start:2071 stop:2808 length:738 start_codon:yes stop_codon:yes gene_type:complete
MTDIEKLKSRIIMTAEDPILTDEHKQIIDALDEELINTVHKRQGFRTPTEMRFSVLNDHRHPTNAAKYWQAVREQSTFYEQLVFLSFRYRQNVIALKRCERDLPKLTDELDIMDKQVEIDELLYFRSTMKIEAKHRVNEIIEWSKIKQELVEATDFDTENVDTHQAASYLQTLQHRVNALLPGAGQGEVLNAVSQLNTLRRLTGQEVKPLEEDVPWLGTLESAVGKMGRTQKEIEDKRKNGNLIH